MAKETPTQEQLIAKFRKAKILAEKAEDAMRQHFNRKYSKQITEAKTVEDILAIKEGLREMPECVGKVLLFRIIIISEEVIKGNFCEKHLIDKNKCECNKK